MQSSAAMIESYPLTPDDPSTLCSSATCLVDVDRDGGAVYAGERLCEHDLCHALSGEEIAATTGDNHSFRAADLDDQDAVRIALDYAKANGYAVRVYLRVEIAVTGKRGCETCEEAV